MKGHNQKPLSIEGLNSARWVLMDYGDVIVHVFEDETRAYYELEKFWMDAPRIPLEEIGIEPLEVKSKK